MGVSSIFVPGKLFARLSLWRKEQYIGPALETRLALAEGQSKILSLEALLKELSHRVSFELYLEIPEFELAPSTPALT